MSPALRIPIAAAAIGVLGFPLAACGGSASSPTPKLVGSGVTTAVATTTTTTTAAVACGYPVAAPKRFSHVIWIWMENHSTQQVIGKPGSTAAKRAPYVNGTLMKSCGLATGYHAVTHPSLPNYLAATSGSTHGIVRDCLPADCPISGRSLFSQVVATGHGWRTYAESMPSRCSRVNDGRYAPKHNPAVYYTALRSTCKANDVSFGTANAGNFVYDVKSNKLRTFSLVEPNLCHDTHDCSIRTGDNWLASVLPVLFTSTDYKEGRTAVFLVWDEGEGGTAGQSCATSTKSSCRMPLIVMSRSVPAGTRVGTTVSHYSLLRTTESMLGITEHLGRARTAPDLRASFGLT